MDNSPVMKKRRKEEEEKADDLTLQECQEANFDLIMTLANQGLWHICEQIFGHLNYETVENCRKVSELWNESLERIALITFLQEFGDRDVEHCPWPLWEEDLDPEIKVSFIVDGWKKAAKEYGFQASLEDLQEVKDSLQNLLNRENAKCCEYPVHEAAKIGAVKLMEFILRTSFVVIHRLHDFDVGRHRHRHFEMSAKPTPTPTSNRHHKILVYFTYFSFFSVL